MLVESMNPTEITNEILNDWENVIKSEERLANEYNKERLRFKIDKNLTYCKAYPIKTGKKNTWILFLSKAPSVERFKGVESINMCEIVYYYSSIGLRIFKKNVTGGLTIYNGHLFKRYNERMNLGLKEPIDIVKHFFSINGYFTSQIIVKEGKELTVTVCKEGLLLGELQEGRMWLVQKTFISKELTKIDQDEIEGKLIKSLHEEIQLELTKKDYNKEKYFYRADILKGIK